MPILQIIIEILTGVSGEEDFSAELIMHINSVITTLASSFGVTQFQGVQIDETTVWPDFTGAEELETHVKLYLAMKVRLLFDPPTSLTVLEAYNKNLTEVEGRLLILVSEIEEAAV